MSPFSLAPARLPATAANIKRAHTFCLAQWQQRHLERHGEGGRAWMPTDLSSACKFTSLFAQAVFGGALEGNEDHQFVRLPSGDILDLNTASQDVVELGSKAHQHDPAWWGNADHRKSMTSCQPRVEAWLQAVEKEWGLAPREPVAAASRRSMRRRP